MGPNLARLLTTCWDWQRIVSKTGKFLGKYFRTGRVLTQGYPVSLMIFSIVVGAVVQEVLGVVCIPQEAQHGLVWEAGERNIIFYANNGRIAGRDYVWVQDALSVTVAMFRRMGLEKNLENNKTIVFTPGFVWGEWGEQACKRRATGEGATFREQNRLRVSYAKCRVTVAQSSLKHHMSSQHVICVPHERWVDEKGYGPSTYVVSFPRVLQLVRCPVPGCPVVSHSAVRLRGNFMFRHLRYWIEVFQEGI